MTLILLDRNEGLVVVGVIVTAFIESSLFAINYANWFPHNISFNTHNYLLRLGYSYSSCINKETGSKELTNGAKITAFK